MNISLVVACTLDGVIGNDKGLPWHLPADLARFKKITLRKPIVMGRKTWETLPFKPLPERRNIVLSRNSLLVLPGAEVTHTVEELAELIGDTQECMIIGGAEIYKLFLPLAKTIYCTQVKVRLGNGDYIPFPPEVSSPDLFAPALFPNFEKKQWRRQSEVFKADEKNIYNMEFFRLRRIK